MPESLQIVLGICFLFVVYILTRWGTVVRMRRAALSIIDDLEANRAFDPATAVKLPYEQPSVLRMGMRDFRPKALKSLVVGGILGKTDDSRFYLERRDARDLLMKTW